MRRLNCAIVKRFKFEQWRGAKAGQFYASFCKGSDKVGFGLHMGKGGPNGILTVEVSQFLCRLLETSWRFSLFLVFFPPSQEQEPLQVLELLLEIIQMLVKLYIEDKQNGGGLMRGVDFNRGIEIDEGLLNVLGHPYAVIMHEP